LHRHGRKCQQIQNRGKKKALGAKKGEEIKGKIWGKAVVRVFENNREKGEKPRERNLALKKKQRLGEEKTGTTQKGNSPAWRNKLPGLWCDGARQRARKAKNMEKGGKRIRREKKCALWKKTLQGPCKKAGLGGPTINQLDRIETREWWVRA